jgi:uncharacterized small protein (DUF1192 family)
VRNVFDDDEPVRKKARLEPLKLDTLSIDELNEYIGELEREIERCRADIAAKQKHRGAAEALFKS